VNFLIAPERRMTRVDRYSLRRRWAASFVRDPADSQEIMNTVLTRTAVIVMFAAMLTVGCGVSRDDTTTATRHIIAEQFGIAFDAVKPTTTLGELGCDELDVVEIIMSLEEQFDIFIPDDEFEALSRQAGWSGITVLELANLARSKR